MDRKYLVVYDICNQSRLIGVAKIMEDYGERVQLSVFECALNRQRIDTLRKRLLKVIDPETDGIKFYPICPKCEQKQHGIGRNLETDLFQELVVI